MNGVQDIWYTNGKQRSETIYKDGKKNGLCRTWRYNGEICSASEYVNGELEEFNYWSEAGRLLITRFYKNGVEEKYQQWFPNGKLHIESTADGGYKEWDKDGKLLCSEN